MHVIELPVSYNITTSEFVKYALTDGLLVGSPSAAMVSRSL
jgi:hypothetical protein